MSHRPYLPIEPALVDHPKTRALAKIWGCHPYTVVGFLVKLWGYCLEFQEDGTVDGRPADVLDELAAPCMATSIGTLPTVRDALLRVGFIDEDGRLHDWEDYAGALVERRRKDRRRKRLARRAIPLDGRGTSAGPGADRRGKSARRVEKSRVEKTDTAAVSVRADGITPPAQTDYLIACTVACNTGLHANPRIGERCNELVASSQTAPLDWYAAGILQDIAVAAIHASAIAYQPKARNLQPRDLRYFDGAVRDAWERHEQRARPAASVPAPATYAGTAFREAT